MDLLYNGGIGTYVKATPQTHAEVGDRANDAIRVNGKELRCKVVAEAGNLGFTHLGRVEYALNAGKINTDAIDNSAGVDCSDHEVNIKILLNSVVAEGRMSGEQRNNLLAEMTDEVGALVLRDNYLQIQSLSVRERMLLDAQTRFIKYPGEGLMMRATLWFLRYRNLKDDIAKTVERFAPGVKALAASLNRFLSPDESDGLRQAAERPVFSGANLGAGHWAKGFVEPRT